MVGRDSGEVVGGRVSTGRVRSGVGESVSCVPRVSVAPGVDAAVGVNVGMRDVGTMVGSLLLGIEVSDGAAEGSMNSDGGWELVGSMVVGRIVGETVGSDVTRMALIGDNVGALEGA